MEQDHRSTHEQAPETEAVTRQVRRILASRDFDASSRERALFRFLVQETLAGRGDVLTPVAIAVRVLGRREGFDLSLDPIVRIRAGRLRRSLQRFYRRSGAADPVRIELRRETLVPVFSRGIASSRDRDEPGVPASPATGVALVH